MASARLIALAILLWLPAAASAAADRQSKTFALPAGKILTLEMTVGELRITGSARADVLMEVVRHAPTDDGLARIPIEIEDSGTQLRIHALQTNGGTDPAFRTDFVLDVPRDAQLTPVRVLEGHVTLASLQGAVTVDLQRGSITASDVSGVLRLETHVGHIVLDRARLTAGGLLRLRTFNGDVTLSLSERPRDARIMALALNGTIESAIPLAMKDTWGPRWGEAKPLNR